MADNGGGFDWKAYRYDPSLVAAIIFVVLFSVTTITHLYQLIRTKTWYFIPFVVGGCFQVIGYIGRVLSSRESPNWTLGPFIMQSLLLLLAPALYAASIYMVLGRIIELIDGEKHSLIRKRWLTKLFVAGDVLSFTVQMAGGGLQAAGTLDFLHMGEKIIIAGLFIQIAIFGFFCVVALTFHLRISKNPTSKSIEYRTVWHRHVHTLYIASVLILIRSVFRAIEYIMGNDGYLLRNEVYLYVFDAVLMLGVMVLFNFIHPSEVKALLRGGDMMKGLKLQRI